MLTDTQLKSIAYEMFHSPNPPSSIDAGYTYLGQMISHDIVPSTKLGSMSRKVSGRLDLESLYGSGALYELQFPLDSHLLFKPDGTFKKLAKRDVYRPRKGLQKAVIPEIRNDENVIICQFHRLFQDLHNRLLRDEEFAANGLQARQYTTLLFQLIVIEDFLPKILNQNVYKQYFENNVRCLEGLVNHPKISKIRQSIIPSFFSHASFRFGHSMVLKQYHFDFDNNVHQLGRLMRPNKKLSKKFEFLWEKFFSTKEDQDGPAEENPNKAASIDTAITKQMANLDLIYAKRDIVSLNINAAYEIGLPDGEEFIDFLTEEYGEKVVEGFLGITRLNDLSDAAFEDVEGVTPQNLPLWLYILLEAKQREGGEKLGPLGSALNAEVLVEAMQQATFSVYTHNKFQFADAIKKLGPKLEEIKFIKERKINMINLINFIQS
ncbi:peroxidase family protein [Aliiglaciecola sp. M165]|uniref:peroxidase family protein n=1 Tax=Aliiglaciecola sp. M165 TaxID=2593649 RepID=UPI00117D5CB8|nr:peroxidase family protein [Aliiglaciecola sp. M165]TRY29810.1 hypothetical protein FM019_16700 [Aliiglaciecola sp. M165]